MYLYIKKNYNYMDNNQGKCPHCGANTKAFWHKLSPGLVSVLIKAIEYVKIHNKNCFHYKDLNLNYSEASNLQKLRFHALIAKVPDKAGHWLITKRGGQFLRGEIVVPMRVQTYRNEVKEHSKEMIHISDLRHKFPEFQSKFAYEYQQPVGVAIPLTLFN